MRREEGRGRGERREGERLEGGEEGRERGGKREMRQEGRGRG